MKLQHFRWTAGSAVIALLAFSLILPLAQAQEKAPAKRRPQAKPPTSSDRRKPQRPKRPAELSDQDIADAKAVLKDVWPESAKAIEDSPRPQAARMIITKQWHRLQPLIEMRRKDENQYKLYINDIKSLQAMRRLGARYRQLVKQKKTEEAEKLKTQIEKQAKDRVKHFIKLRKHNLEKQRAHVKKRLEQIDRQVKGLEKDRDKLTDQFIKQAIGSGRSSKELRPIKPKSDKRKVTDSKE